MEVWMDSVVLTIATLAEVAAFYDRWIIVSAWNTLEPESSPLSSAHFCDLPSYRQLLMDLASSIRDSLSASPSRAWSGRFVEEATMQHLQRLTDEKKKKRNLQLRTLATRETGEIPMSV